MLVPFSILADLSRLFFALLAFFCLKKQYHVLSEVEINAGRQLVVYANMIS